MPTAALQCWVCGMSSDDKRLQKCAVCHKMYCNECGFIMSGRRFCSQYCAEYFFHGGDDDL